MPPGPVDPALEPAARLCHTVRMADARTPKTMTDAQREYERKRAEKAGMTLEKWLDAKQKAAPKPDRPARAPGLLSRLIDRAHRPLKKP